MREELAPLQAKFEEDGQPTREVSLCSVIVNTFRTNSIVRLSQPNLLGSLTEDRGVDSLTFTSTNLTDLQLVTDLYDCSSVGVEVPGKPRTAGGEHPCRGGRSGGDLHRRDDRV